MDNKQQPIQSLCLKCSGFTSLDGSGFCNYQDIDVIFYALACPLYKELVIVKTKEIGKN